MWDICLNLRAPLAPKPHPTCGTLIHRNPLPRPLHPCDDKEANEAYTTPTKVHAVLGGIRIRKLDKK